jgi:hypothetical protein
MELFSWFTRPKAKGSRPGSSKRPAQEREYAGAEIVPRKDVCCRAVQSIAGKRFLATEVPLFPLQDCDQPRCDCRYRRYADRRTGVRRAVDLGVGVSGPAMQRSGDRRRASAPGRRAMDLHPE